LADIIQEEGRRLGFFVFKSNQYYTFIASQSPRPASGAWIQTSFKPGPAARKLSGESEISNKK
jgi:hypothetical protein